MASHMTNPLATSAQLERCRNRAPPSLPTDLLDVVFFATQCLTQAAGLLLGLPQSTTAQANVVLARYWLQEPGWDGEDEGGVDYVHVSAAALFVVAKTGAFPRSARDVANVYGYLGASKAFWAKGAGLKGKESQSFPAEVLSSSSYYLSETEYVAFHNRVLALETRILYTLGFDLHVALPHPLAVTYMQALEFLGRGPQGPLSSRTVQYLNTALLSPQLLYLTHQPHELAVAAVYNAARDTGVHMPESCAWWEVFDVDRETLGFLAVALRSVASWAESVKSGEYKELLTGGIVTRKRVADTASRLAEKEADREKPQPADQADKVMTEA